MNNYEKVEFINLENHTNSLLCKSCGFNYFVSDRKIKLSDNDWFYCPCCGSGNVVFVEEV